MHSKALQLLSEIGAPTVMVVGDLILDHYVWGEVSRISPEAPIPVMNLQHGKKEWRLGGAGNVANNLASLGAKVSLAGVLGRDMAGREFAKLARSRGIRRGALLTDTRRPTTLKSRFMASGQQLLRSDEEMTHPIAASLARQLLVKVRRELPHLRALLISDYSKGLLGPATLRSITAMAAKSGIPVLVDPKAADYAVYRGCTVITPNLKEAQEAAGMRVRSKAELRECARRLLKKTRARWVVITLGKEGVYSLGRNGVETQIETEARTVFDVTGAGDTFLAALGLCMAGGAEFGDALRIANAAAGLAVGKLGTAAISREELCRFYSGAGRSEDKIKPVRELAGILALRRKHGERVVFTNGCFDVLHAGHAQYLTFARNQGDLLVVGLNSDASIRRIKGNGRPIVPQTERAELLAALEDVDYVCIFNENTPYQLVKKLLPNVLVKGEDWAAKGAVGRDIVLRNGGKVVYAPLRQGRSTTAIIEKILRVGPALKRN